LIQYFVIPKAQHDETLRCQPLVTSLIISNIITVLSAVDLDDNAALQTDESHDAGTEGFLSLELQPH